MKPLILLLVAAGAIGASLLAGCSGNDAANDNAGGAAGAAAGLGGARPGGAGGGSAGTDSDAAGSAPPDAGAATGLAAKYPCDKDIGTDPAVVIAENFEGASVDAVAARWADVTGTDLMALDPSVPQKSCGTASMRFGASAANTTSHFYKKLDGHEELYWRYYVKYQAGVTWHHTGISLKGYNPPSPWPLGLAGLKPTGSDSFTVALEPIFGVGSANPRFDFYAYGMKMRSWMDVPSGDQAYYGNSFVHQKSFTADDDTWICMEVHLKLNTDMSSSAGMRLEVWKNDVLVQSFGSQSPVGCWIKDNFCPAGADGPECVDYPSLCTQPYVPLDFQLRSTPALNLNAVVFGNYITEGAGGNVWFDDLVIATSRVGCLGPP